MQFYALFNAVFIQRGLVRCAVARIGKGRQASVCQGVSWPGWLRCGAERLGKARFGKAGSGEVR